MAINNELYESLQVTRARYTFGLLSDSLAGDKAKSKIPFRGGVLITQW